MGEILIGARRYAEAFRMHTKQQEIAHALSLADPTNAELQTLEAFAQLGIATVLSKQGLQRDALAKQTWAAGTLRALSDADAKDTEARYNTAFALSEASETLATLGQLDAAERNLRDALRIIERSANSSEPTADDARLLQSIDYFRLAKIDARQANDRATPRAQRASKCGEAKRLFEQSRPVLEAAEREGRWQLEGSDRSVEITKHLGSCANPRAV
jgi:tetratricopeptide (TPR) repeat protein